MIAIQDHSLHLSQQRNDVPHNSPPSRIRQVGKTYELDDDLWLPQPRAEIFDFFSDAANLTRITPAFLQFEILSPQPIEMRVGALIEYRLKVRGVPIRWHSRITVWDPPHCFVDEQVRGPYRLWRHEHIFVPEAGGTRISDRVEFLSKGGPLAPLLHRLLVNRDVRFIFTHRRKTLKRMFHHDGD